MQIKGIFLCEFNFELGLRLVSQISDQKIISQKQFKLYAKMILPKWQLCNRMLTIEYREKYFILGVPSVSVNSETDQKYLRQKYIYSINLIITKELYLKYTQRYKELVRKLTYFFISLEQSSHLIYENHSHMPYIQKTLAEIYHNINSNHQINLTYLCNSYSFINLNASPISHQTPIQTSSVPLTNLTLPQIQSIQSQLGRILLEYAYKGQFTIKKIYDILKLKMNDFVIDQMYRFYETGIKLGVVFMVDLFSLDNCYSLTEQMHNYVSGKEGYQQRFSEACKQMRFTDNIGEQMSEEQILVSYFAIQRKVPIKIFLQKQKSRFKKINFVKWIRLGQILKIIRRVYDRIIYHIAPEPLILGHQLRTHCAYLWQQNQDRKKPQDDINIKFKQHLLHRDTIQKMCVDMEIDRQTLFLISNPSNRYIVFSTSNQ